MSGIDINLGARHASPMLRLIACILLLATSATAQPTLRVGFAATQSATLDPHRASATEDVGLVSWIFSGLMRFPPGSADPAAIEPDLAQAVEHSPDGLTWTFSIRPGVFFHDGTALTAADAVASLRRAADPKRSSFATDYADVASIEATDPMTVRLTLRRPVPSLPSLVANYHGGMIMPAHLVDDPAVAGRPVGTGPFAWAATAPGSTTLKAFPAYWRGAPRLAGIEVRFLLSDQTRELALTTGEIDLMVGRREQRWVERMRAQRDLTVDVFGPGEFRTLLLNRAAPPLDDIRVREAVAHAIDVAAIVRFVGPDVATIGRSPVPPGQLGEVAVDLPKPDLAATRRLLAEAGHPGGIVLRAVVSNISAQLPIMEVVQSQLRRAGIALQMDVVEHATYHARIRQDLSQVTFYGAARLPVADAYLSAMYHGRAAPGQATMNLNFAHCDAADDEIDAARGEPDPGRQKALWAEAQRKIAAQICSVPLFDLRQVWARTTRLDWGYPLAGALNLVPAVTEATTLR